MHFSGNTEHRMSNTECRMSAFYVLGIQVNFFVRIYCDEEEFRF